MHNHEFNVSDEFNSKGLANSSGNLKISGIVVGIPNSGKSTLINALRNTGKGGTGGAAKVGRLAGQTRLVGQPIVISRGSGQKVDPNGMFDTKDLMDYRVELFDTPGILQPHARTLCEQLSLCVCGAINLEKVDQGTSLLYIYI